jgi:hypothetical protein
MEPVVGIGGDDADLTARKLNEVVEYLWTSQEMLCTTQFVPENIYFSTVYVQSGKL